MNPFRQPNASVFVPDGLAPDAALARTTHLGIGAHQDDLEFMALHGILACFQRSDRWFGLHFWLPMPSTSAAELLPAPAQPT